MIFWRRPFCMPSVIIRSRRRIFYLTARTTDIVVCSNPPQILIYINLFQYLFRYYMTAYISGYRHSILQRWLGILSAVAGCLSSAVNWPYVLPFRMKKMSIYLPFENGAENIGYSSASVQKTTISREWSMLLGSAPFLILAIMLLLSIHFKLSSLYKEVNAASGALYDPLVVKAVWNHLLVRKKTFIDVFIWTDLPQFQDR